MFLLHPSPTIQTLQPMMQNMHITADSQPSLGWICTHPSLFAIAKASFDEEYADTPAKPDNNVIVCSGRIGTVKVAINCLPHPLTSGDVVSAVRSIVTSLMPLKSFLVTSFDTGLIGHDIKPGDLIISQLDAADQGVSEPISTRKWSVSQQAAMLQREVGADGHWLSSNFSTAFSSSPDPLQPVTDVGSYTNLNYGNLDQASPNSPIKKFWNKMLAVKNDPDVEAVAQGI
jgi:hypothetical protein